jgi:hypothetical protein
MKLQIPLLIGILGLSTCVSFPAVAQTNNRLENFFGGTPPYTGDHITRPLNQVEETPDLDYPRTQESAPIQQTTNDEQSENTLTYPRQRQSSQDADYEQPQQPAVTTPTTDDN